MAMLGEAMVFSQVTKNNLKSDIPATEDLPVTEELPVGKVSLLTNE